MNQRIQELAEQAGIVFWEISGDVDWRQANRENLGKFAELILKECFQYLENEEDRLWDLSEKEEDDIFQSNFEICAEKCRDVRQGLKDHFGVTE